jgi:hypothetical protein
MTILQFHPMKV